MGVRRYIYAEAKTMSNVKEKATGAHKESNPDISNVLAPRNKKAKKGDQADITKLAKIALRVGILTAVAAFVVAFYGYGASALWSVAIAVGAFIFIQPVIGVVAAVKLAKLK